jgi:3-phenylpropionate/trans-cinnamate dioxygenase ferredoxin component
MPDFVRVASLGDLPDDEVVAAEVDGTAICLVKLDGEVYAFADKCSHRDYPLNHGELDVEECAITCEWHGAQFDIRTGRPLSLPATKPIPVYAVRLEGDDVLVARPGD